MSYRKRRESNYSTIGAVVGGISGAVGGTALGSYIYWTNSVDGEYGSGPIAVALALSIPVFLVVGSVLGAYVGGRLLSRNNSL